MNGIDPSQAVHKTKREKKGKKRKRKNKQTYRAGEKKKKATQSKFKQFQSITRTSMPSFKFDALQAIKYSQLRVKGRENFFFF